MYLYKKIAVTNRELFFEAHRESYQIGKEKTYNKEVSNKESYNEEAYNRKTYDKKTYSKETCNKETYDKKTYDRETCDKKACDNGDYIEHLVKLAEKVDLMILREKNLSTKEYKILAENLLEALENKDILVLHTHIKTALQINHKKIHLPLNIFRENFSLLHKFELTGVSVHSLEEARFAEEHGADYLVAGHIFQTECKKDLKPKGLDFLENICENIKIPVYALGGITKENELDTIKVGALGACRMSDYMK